MKEYFVIVVQVMFSMKESEWIYKEYDNYPSNEEIETAIRHYDGSGTRYEKAKVWYARVEKRYAIVR